MEELQEEASTTYQIVMMMNWMLSQSELDAADVLIQLSGSDSPRYSGRSSSSKGDGDAASSGSCERLDRYVIEDDELLAAVSIDESHCATTSGAASTAIDDQNIDQDRLSSSSSPVSTKRQGHVLDKKAASVDGCGEIEGFFPRKKRKFRFILDLYAQTKPYVESN